MTTATGKKIARVCSISIAPAVVILLGSDPQNDPYPDLVIVFRFAFVGLLIILVFLLIPLYLRYFDERKKLAESRSIKRRKAREKNS